MDQETPHGFSVARQRHGFQPDVEDSLVEGCGQKAARVASGSFDG
jgi:hypothetical protein